MPSLRPNLLPAADLAWHEQEYIRLCQALETASTQSHLPAEPTAKPALQDFLVRVRMGME